MQPMPGCPIISFSHSSGENFHQVAHEELQYVDAYPWSAPLCLLLAKKDTLYQLAVHMP